MKKHQSNWHILPLAEITKLLSTKPEGLTNAIALQRITEFGKNQIEDKKKKTVWHMVLNQLKDFMILILFAAAIISGLLGDLTDTIIIFAIIIINAVVGFIQEYRADKAIEALKKMAANNAKVLRDNKTIEIPTIDLVPGDVLLLEAGNIIAADIRFFETHQLKVDESALTGESENVEKFPEELPEGDYALGDRTNIGFKGTFVTNGRALAYVIETGMNTELGSIARMIQTDETVTPLQKRLAAFGKRLSVIILIICAIIFGFGLLRGENILTMLLTSISLAVAAIPEALPALVTVALALGAKELVKSKALIRKLPAVETLGSVNVICTDKTGTLTINKMTVEEVFETSDKSFHSIFDTENSLFNAMALNNDVTMDKNGKWIGDSTEVAMVRYAFDKDFKRESLENKFKRLAEIPFDSTRKCMTTFHETPNGVVAITKGAVEIILKKLAENQTQELKDFELNANKMAEQGYRVLAFGMKTFETKPTDLKAENIESSLTLVGFVGLMDPPREEVKKAIEQCKKAGIITVMITGDHKLTSQAIAKQLGILSTEEDKILSGAELEDLSISQFKKIVENVRVYARVNPEQKLQIVKALQEKNHFVAMTGDGVNDAPALKNADIGIAMGINGTEVSKEASHMILLDDNFSTIVKAVKHGRRVFDNILKFIKYIMTGNSGEIWAIFLAPFLGLPIPLLPIHILWINLITDGLPGLALASEPAEKNIMNRQPRSATQNIFAGGMAVHILWVGFLIGATTLGMQAWGIYNGKTHWQTMAFSVLCFSQLGHAMAVRSELESIFKIGVFSNKPMLLAILITVGLQLMVIYIPFLNQVFKTEPLTLIELAITIAVSSIVFWAVEIEKRVKRFRMVKVNSEVLPQIQKI
jgi:Ca2+-transporting ATPase